MDALIPPPIPLLGLEFDDLTLVELLAGLLARPAGARFAYLVTPNADHLARLRRLPCLRRVYAQAGWRVLDSQVVARVARVFGLPRPQVVTGADLIAALLPRLAGQRVAVIGLGAAELAALARRYPAIVFLHHQPPMGLGRNPAACAAAVAFAHAAQAAFTIFAVGSPVQEVLAYTLARRPGAVGIGLCTGAALRFAAGTLPRAPAWMRRHGLEWLHRLGQEPLRLAGRYFLASPPALLALAWSARPQKGG